MELRPYQQRGRDFLANTPRAFLGDEMGLGKGGQSVSAALQVNAKRVLFVAPASTLLGLSDEIQRWGGPAPVILDQAGKVDVPAGPAWMLLAWTSAVTRKPCLLKKERLDVLVLDEAQRCKSPKAKMTRAVLGRIMRKEDGRIVRTRCLATHADRLWALSGTPIENRPIDLQQMLYLGLNQAWAERTAYGDRYCHRYNRNDPRGFDYNGAQNLAELAGKLAATGAFLRRTAEDVPGELPDLCVQVVPLDAPEAPCALDKAALLAAIGKGYPAPFEDCAQYRREQGLKKVPAVCSWLSNFLEDEEAAVVFAWHPEVLERIKERMKLDCPVIHGGTSHAARKAAVDAFAGGAHRVFLGTIGACGVGINGLHLRTSACVFAECSWVPAHMTQAIGRVRRIGGTGMAARAYILCARDSLEAHVMQTVAGKIDVSGAVLAGVTGEGWEFLQ
jgi:SNF2 family DNA or RNA helicase